MMIVTLANEEKLNMSAAVIDDTIDFMKERELIELRATTTGINGIEFVLTKAGEIFMDRKVSQIEALRKQRAEAELASEAEAESA